MSARRTEEWLSAHNARRKGGRSSASAKEGNASGGLNAAQSALLQRHSEPLRISQEVKHDYKAEFEQQMTLIDLEFEREFYFALPKRKWRADWKIRTTKVLIEFEGGLFAKDKIGHGNVGGILRDIEKGNDAALLGYILIRITPKHVTSGQALNWVEQAVILDAFGPAPWETK